jgi:choline kinase
MKCIVPLAGPDVWSETSGLRPLFEVDGRPLIDLALTTRAWADKLAGEDYVFVLRETEGRERLAAHLASGFPGCRFVTLSHLTGGALFSVLAAMALVAPQEAVIVDLADILFSDGPADPAALFADGTLGAIVPVFASQESCYSYLRMEDGRVVEAREKVVISENASAGVYMFRDIEVFLQAAAHSIAHRETLAHRNSLFICPMVNGVVACGLMVAAPTVNDSRPVGKLFHVND